MHHLLFYVWYLEIGNRQFEIGTFRLKVTIYYENVPAETVTQKHEFINTAQVNLLECNNAGCR